LEERKRGRAVAEARRAREFVVGIAERDGVLESPVERGATHSQGGNHREHHQTALQPPAGIRSPP